MNEKTEKKIKELNERLRILDRKLKFANNHKKNAMKKIAKIKNELKNIKAQLDSIKIKEIKELAYNPETKEKLKQLGVDVESL